MEFIASPNQHSQSVSSRKK